MTTPSPEAAEAARLLERAALAHQSQDHDGARRAYQQVLQLAPDSTAAYVGLSALRFPGPGYLDVMSQIHKMLRPRTYVEIGVADVRRVGFGG